MPDLFHFLIYSLACFRLATLISQDDAPWKVMAKLRSKLKREAKQHPVVRKSAIHQGIECLRCSSVWMATPVAVFAVFKTNLPPWLATTGDVFCLAMALSSGAILWHRAFPKR